MKIPKNIKQLLNDENKTKLIGLLTICLLLWIILYFIPEIIISLFNTILGNLILLIITILLFSYNLKYGIIVAIVLIILYRFTHLSLVKSKEGFTWNPKSTLDFLQIQHTINPNSIFDVKMIQETQASQEEVDYFNKNGIWPWSKETQELYLNALNKNPFIRTYSKTELKRIRTIYNESAILRILYYQSKEGQLLINGVKIKNPSGNKLEELPSGFGIFPYLSGLLQNRTDDVIKCNMKKPNNYILERTTYTGKDGIYGEQLYKKSHVNYNNLENIIPGFSFSNGPCNPCKNINQNIDSCKFTLK